MMTPITCACDRCRDACARSTCLPTPDEARALIRAGLGDRLATYEFDGQRFVGPAPKGQEGARGLWHTRHEGGCTFFDGRHCELHARGLKPLEGRLAHHDRPWLPVRLHVMAHWRGKQFESVDKALYRMSIGEQRALSRALFRSVQFIDQPTI